MIKNIRIRNFAIIENADIEFHDGLNIITGETGAGKSIVIEAVSLALGSRADTAFVRSGKEKATVQMLADFEGKEYLISREISSSGRNTCQINDELVTLATLSNICRKIADIHGQYDHQSLLNKDLHMNLVDTYRKDLIIPAREAVELLYDRYIELRDKLASLDSQLAESRRQRDFMEFELKEIREAALSPGEDNELKEKIDLLQNSEKIYNNLSGAYHITNDSDFSLLSAMKQVSDMLSETSGFSSELAALGSRMSELYYEFEDACSSLRECRDRTVFSTEELDMAIERLELINRLKSKHGKDIEALLLYADEIEENLSRISNSDEYRVKLKEEIEICRSSLSDACSNLSKARRESASILQKLISEQLQQLNFSSADFLIDFKSSDCFTREGTDIVEFLISTNRGEPLKPLSKIASGGEMSRIMLAFKKIIGDYDEIPTMIFDEIDSGISGIAASVVGRKLHEIAGNHQIICITHLPQIAACGDYNYRISKHSDDSMTFTSIDQLNEDDKIYEIARLLGGENITETTLASARELVGASHR